MLWHGNPFNANKVQKIEEYAVVSGFYHFNG